MHFPNDYNVNPDNLTIATMLGNFQGEVPGMQLFRWWHLDQRDGMIEQLKTLANVGLLSRFVGANGFSIFSFISKARIFLQDSRNFWGNARRLCSQ